MYPRQSLVRTLLRGPVIYLTLIPNPWTKGFSPLAAEASPTRSLSLSTLPSVSGSSHVKEGTPDEMDVADETIDVVDEAIAAIKEYKDRVPEEEYSPPEVDLHRESVVPLSVWFDLESHVRDHVDIKGSQMNPKHLTKGTISSTDSEEIKSPSPKPGTHMYTLSLELRYAERIPMNQLMW